ncbi:hypothetical protein E3N88_36152 [Mikania micrantha]|uniref:Ferric oxidoreductase domain-containing protein n=1 Tax=Mikania micrantha TaxID=192012 RepID=A0A5N6M3C1_9ASTR|nr:hypothetical protein E3N88_36152 [Mikania micrantha]
MGRKEVRMENGMHNEDEECMGNEGVKNKPLKMGIGNLGGRLSRNCGRVAGSTSTSSRRRLRTIDEPRLERQRSGAARGLNGLRFLDRVMTGKEVDAWMAIEKRFQRFSVDGRLPREKFGICVGMNDGSEFSGELFDALMWQLETLLKSMATSKEATMSSDDTTDLAKTMIPEDYRNPWRKFMINVFESGLENWKVFWILFLFLEINVALFLWKFHQYTMMPSYQVFGYCSCTAKGAGETLKFNMALILLPVCRRTLTTIRETYLGKVLPLDENINFHKIIALAIAMGTVIHTVAHMGCNFIRLSRCPRNQFMAIFGGLFVTQPSYMDLVLSIPGYTGIIMIILMAICFTFATSSFRRNVVKLPHPLNNLAGFTSFWYTHHLLNIVYFLFIVHGYFLVLTVGWYRKTTWMYLLLPMLCYASERLLTTDHTMQVDTIKAIIYAGNVLALYMTKPIGFKYKSGMYLFVQCPHISRFEW